MKFVVMRSDFGDYWIAKTTAELPDSVRAFNEFEDAKETALSLNDSIENEEELIDLTEDDVEEIDKDMFKWLA